MSPKILWKKFSLTFESQGLKAAHKTKGEELSYSTLLREANLLAAELADAGAGRGSRCLFLGSDGVPFLRALFACWKLGACFIPIGPSIPEREKERLKQELKPHFLIYNTSLAKTPSRAERFPPDLALMLFSSGTEGKIKPAPLTASAIFHSITSAAKYQQIKSSSRILATLSFFHSGGLFIQTLPALLKGATIVGTEGNLPRALSIPKLTHTILIPSQVEMTSRSRAWGRIPLKSFQFIVTGSADISRAASLLLSRGARVMNVYGLTETCSFSFFKILSRKDKAFPAGKAIPRLKVKVSGVAIKISGISSPRYEWKNRLKMRNNKWLNTGDIGKLQNDMLFVLGREAGLVRMGSITIHSRQIENILQEFPGVKECAIKKVPHYLLGEIPVAYIVTKNPTKELAFKIRHYCESTLGRERSPKRYHIRKDDLPRNSMGKVDLNALA